MADLAADAKKVRDLEHQLNVARTQLDCRLFYWHEDDVSVTELAAAAGISRETAYKSIDRYRRSLSPELPFD
jgi:predicted DNA-binding protein YlxM (UPF0122 family)